METLFVFDQKDYNESWAHSVRHAVRAVIRSGDRYAMVYSKRDKYYKFPGGGMEENEAHADTLIREVREELGLSVIPESIRELYEALELRKSEYFPETVYEHHSFYYFCETEDSIAEQNLDRYEAEEGFCLCYVTAEEALKANRLCTSVENSHIVARDSHILRHISSVGEQP